MIIVYGGIGQISDVMKSCSDAEKIWWIKSQISDSMSGKKRCTSDSELQSGCCMVIYKLKIESLVVGMLRVPLQDNNVLGCIERTTGCALRALTASGGILAAATVSIFIIRFQAHK